MTEHEPVRWGILSTARIAVSSFLPGLRVAGGGVPYVVAGRDAARTERFAREHDIEHARQGYETVIEDERVDAVYIPLPNTLHVEWAERALAAGKVVLCEKPLSADLAAAERIVTAAEQRAGLLWEAFVFPFREQSARVREIIELGEIGEVKEVNSIFHFQMEQTEDIRLDPDLGGGALLDVGCYCVAFARYVLAAEPLGAMARATWTDTGVDAELAGVLDFPADRRLVFSCGFRLPAGTATLVLGTEGQLRIDSPFHPGRGDRLLLERADGTTEDRSTENAEPTFSRAIHHIHRVLWGEESPRHLATTDALGNAVALDRLIRSARSGQYEVV